MKDNDVLEQLAKTINIPEWATHVAVRKDGSKVEPATWLEEVDDYVDEDPSSNSVVGWIGSYKHHYWAFFSKEDLNTKE